MPTEDLTIEEKIKRSARQEVVDRNPYMEGADVHILESNPPYLVKVTKTPKSSHLMRSFLLEMDNDGSLRRFLPGFQVLNRYTQRHRRGR